MDSKSRYVYFIQEGDDGPIKIGKTSGHPANRMSGVQTGNARALRLLGALPGYTKEETDLHRRFAAHRIRGEWFRPHVELLDFITTLPPENCIFDIYEVGHQLGSMLGGTLKVLWAMGPATSTNYTTIGSLSAAASNGVRAISALASLYPDLRQGLIDSGAFSESDGFGDLEDRVYDIFNDAGIEWSRANEEPNP